MEEATEVRGMGGDPKRAVEHFTDALARPGLPTQPRRFPPPHGPRAPGAERVALARAPARDPGLDAAAHLPPPPLPRPGLPTGPPLHQSPPRARPAPCCPPP